MGQSQSKDFESHVSIEQLRHRLAAKFAKQCFTSIEISSFSEVFESLADEKDGRSFVTEMKIASFLEIPPMLGVAPVVFQMISYLGAFPFHHEVPACVEFDQLIVAVVMMTKRYQRLMTKDEHQRIQLIFRSLAIWDRKESQETIDYPEKISMELQGKNAPPPVIPVTASTEHNVLSEEEKEKCDDNKLASAALEIIGVFDAPQSSHIPISKTSIPSKNFKKFIMLLLLVAPLSSHESLSSYTENLNGDSLERLRKTADNIMASFVDSEKPPGIKFHRLDTVISISLPYFFNGLIPLFEQFIFSLKSNITKQKEFPSFPSKVPVLKTNQPLLPLTGEILDLHVLSQLSFFLPSSILFRRLLLLYSGSDAGFSMGSFETHVFNWQAPTILLISGNRIVENSTGGNERGFNDTLPPKRFPDSDKATHLVFGVYLSQHWRHTHKTCFGDSDTLLFQLEPVHEVFHASRINTDYVGFSKKSQFFQGITVGCPQIKSNQASGLTTRVILGDVSLLLDSSFEFGVFTHNYTSNGGAFHRSRTRRFDWEDRFEIESVEVWGCGDDKDAEQQKTRWQWEEREAEARRRINLGSGDIESDRALLEMAGLIDGNRSGGSMN
ncbi:Restriction of telomere capping protein 5 [Golovinomyces cichoracearum]|uniref:Restriction of telomere capping protein 5 n=1 Tax=Golovinomyces cichoracearum TaxID=62708 RepID=A0A420H8B8_9PEZI|nr:Restriction of telomere capping protein 5 [Golovinomyces cichoracearum]